MPLHAYFFCQINLRVCEFNRRRIDLPKNFKPDIRNTKSNSRYFFSNCWTVCIFLFWFSDSPMVSPLVLLLSLCLVCYKSAAVADLMSEFDHNAVLDTHEKMKLYWSTDLDAKIIYFAMEAVSTGWVGLGFSENGAMIGSDVVIGWVKDGKGNLKVLHGDYDNT